MEQAEVAECRMIPRVPDPQGLNFFESADVVLLAGGDLELGWRSFEENGLKQLIQRQYLAGVLLIGVSAGAVQLGLGGLLNDGATLLSTFGLLPFHIAAHEERDDWASLRKVVDLTGRQSTGLGIPSGGGISYCAGKLKVLFKAVFKIVEENGHIRERLLLPDTLDSTP